MNDENKINKSREELEFEVSHLFCLSGRGPVMDKLTEERIIGDCSRSRYSDLDGDRWDNSKYEYSPH